MGHHEPWSPNWATPLPGLERTPIHDEAKDEFIHRLMAFMRERHDFGYSSRSIASPSGGHLIEYKLNTADDREKARLWIWSIEGFFEFSAVGQGEAADDDLEIWRCGIETCLSALGQVTAVEWTAILAEGPGISSGGQQLQQSAKHGETRFELVTGCISEDSSAAMGQLGLAILPRFHFPIQASGITSCYAWEQDGDWRTLERIRLITALLSLAWDGHWTIREGPRPSGVTWGDLPRPLMGNAWRPVAADHPLAVGQPVTVPTWLDQALGKLETDRRMKDALLMHHEGVSLLHDHPSIALVCFTATIEAVAQIGKKPNRCTECRSVLSSRERFEEAVRGVVSPQEAAYLVDAYAERSKTVHQGKMHGTEGRMGSWGAMSLFLADRTASFEMGTVRAARQASRLLLLKQVCATT